MDEPTEQWRQIPDYGGAYEASDLGRIRSWNTSHPNVRASEPHVLKQNLNPRGYYWVPLREPDTTRRSRAVHCLVLEAFVGPRPPEYEACHGDGTRTNNRLANLRWDSRTANMMDKHLHGRWPGRLTRCRKGHELTLENTIETADRTGRVDRRCRTCRRLSDRTAYERKRSGAVT